MSDLISRQAAIDALWKALYDYEDKTEKQFKESDALDVGDWIEHRIFVQNMGDIDRQVIRDLPTAQPERMRGGASNTKVIKCWECKFSDWYTTASGERRCYCMEHGSSGHMKNDFCSYAESAYMREDDG